MAKTNLCRGFRRFRKPVRETLLVPLEISRMRLRAPRSDVPRAKKSDGKNYWFQLGATCNIEASQQASRRPRGLALEHNH